MRKIIIKSFLFIGILTSFYSPSLFALDPIAPKSERAFGFLSVTTPLYTDMLEIKSDNFSTTFKSEEMIKVPIGDYILTVMMQDNVKSTQKVSVMPTELTAINITGFGNLFVKAPNASRTVVEVYSIHNKLVSRFMASKIKTLPIGTYRVNIKMPPEEMANMDKVYTSEVTKNDVRIITNETRELIVWK